MGCQALALLKQLEAAAQAADDLAEATRLVFQQHPRVARQPRKLVKIAIADVAERESSRLGEVIGGLGGASSCLSKASA